MGQCLLFTAPTALSNGPTIIEAQADFVLAAIEKLEKEGARSIEPNQASEDEWDSMIDKMSHLTLIPLTNSWWNAANVPGKKNQMLTHVGGIDMYEKQCRETLTDWKGFTVIHGKDGVAEETVNEKTNGIVEEDIITNENGVLKQNGVPEATGIEVGPV